MQSLDVILFTNAWKPPPQRSITYGYGLHAHHSAFRFGGSPPRSYEEGSLASHSASRSSSAIGWRLSAPSTTSQLQPYAIPVDIIVPLREKFPETWLWESIDDIE